MSKETEVPGQHRGVREAFRLLGRVLTNRSSLALAPIKALALSILPRRGSGSKTNGNSVKAAGRLE